MTKSALAHARTAWGPPLSPTAQLVSAAAAASVSNVVMVLASTPSTVLSSAIGSTEDSVVTPLDALRLERVGRVGKLGRGNLGGSEEHVDLVRRGGESGRGVSEDTVATHAPKSLDSFALV